MGGAESVRALYPPKVSLVPEFEAKAVDGDDLMDVSSPSVLNFTPRKCAGPILLRPPLRLPSLISVLLSDSTTIMRFEAWQTLNYAYLQQRRLSDRVDHIDQMCHRQEATSEAIFRSLSQLGELRASQIQSLLW
ncbi:hypothetical protein Golomagni_00364 [Golovinomyces magnicellulatus]|nr:hypothetical protein Golomagni_00364 [Golovinomyces magnicellulatus]